MKIICCEVIKIKIDIFGVVKAILYVVIYYRNFCNLIIDSKILIFTILF